jgi:hypothetical protein
MSQGSESEDALSAERRCGKARESGPDIPTVDRFHTQPEGEARRAGEFTALTRARGADRLRVGCAEPIRERQTVPSQRV